MAFASVTTNLFAVGTSVGLFCLSTYSNLYITYRKWVNKIYYNVDMSKKLIDFTSECIHFFSKNYTRYRFEPWFDSWFSIGYIKYNDNGTITYVDDFINTSVVEKTRKIFFKNTDTKYNIKLIVPSVFYTEKIIIGLEPVYRNSIEDIFRSISEQCYHSNKLDIYKDSILNCAINKDTPDDTAVVSNMKDEKDFLMIFKFSNMYICRIGAKYVCDNVDWFHNNISIKKVKKSFLCVEYSHPDMTKKIFLNIDSGFYVENNEILSPTFVRKCLEYQNEEFVFDDKYVLNMLDTTMKQFTMNYKEYILITKEGYQIYRIISNVSYIPQ